MRPVRIKDLEFHHLFSSNRIPPQLKQRALGLSEVEIRASLKAGGSTWEQFNILKRNEND